MTDFHNQTERQVLVIEPDAALRRVMTLGLRQRGLHVVEASSLGDAWELAQDPPSLIVLDVGVGANSEWMLLRTLRAHRMLGAAPAVLLAWECPSDAALLGDGASRYLCLSKPFDARALYNAVETLLAAQAAPAAAGATHNRATVPAVTVATAARVAPQDPVPAAFESTPGAAPSIWPLVAAGGLTLAVVGLLINVAFVLVGAAILFVAILWWTADAAQPAPGA
jgi:DNA-binding response OmpR family regulator